MRPPLFFFFFKYPNLAPPPLCQNFSYSHDLGDLLKQSHIGGVGGMSGMPNINHDLWDTKSYVVNKFQQSVELLNFSK